MGPEILAGIVIAVIGILAAPLTEAVRWIANRKRNVADVNNIFTSSSKTMIEAMNMTMESLREDLEAAMAKIDHLQAEIESLRAQNYKLVHENSLLSAKLTDLTNKLDNTGPQQIV